MKLARKVLFWCHLTAGVLAGVVILVMSATGAALALQPQILAWLERGVQRVDAQGATRLPLAQLVTNATAVHREGTPGTITVEADPALAVAVSFGREDVLYVNPYSGAVLGGGAAGARRVFQQMNEWHRWLAVEGEGRTTARAITGASNLAFLFLGSSGLLLWIPRGIWTRVRLRSVLAIDLAARGKARDFNWHNAIGFWCAPVIVVLTATGAVMSYPWANNLVYKLAGSPLPQQGGGQGGGRQGAPGGPAGAPGSGNAGREGAGRGGDQRRAEARPALDYASLDRAEARAAETMPTWRNIALRLPPNGNGPITMTLTDRAHWNKFARSNLTVQPATGEVVRWEPYAAQSAGQKARGWVRFGHTGELGGLLGQIVAGLASAGGVFLVWTGISLALRRLANWRRSASRVIKRAA